MQYLQYIDDVGLEIDDFKSEAIRIAIYIIAGLWLLLSYVWIFYSDTRKVSGLVKQKNTNLLGYFLVLINVITLVVCWYFFLSAIKIQWLYESSSIFSIKIFIVLYTSLYYYLSSLFITSSAMRTGAFRGEA